MFCIDKGLIKLININARMEKHGNDDVLACDLKVTYRASNDVLSEFSPTLKNSLYWKDESIQGELINEVGYAPNLRHPKMSPFKWDQEYENSLLRIHHGVRDEDDIVFHDAKINSFGIECQEGGTVIVTFRAQVNPDEQQAAKLMSLLNSEVHATVVTDIEPTEEQLKAAA